MYILLGLYALDSVNSSIFFFFLALSFLYFWGLACSYVCFSRSSMLDLVWWYFFRCFFGYSLMKFVVGSAKKYIFLLANIRNLTWVLTIIRYSWKCRCLLGTRGGRATGTWRCWRSAFSYSNERVGWAWDNIYYLRSWPCNCIFWVADATI